MTLMIYADERSNNYYYFNRCRTSAFVPCENSPPRVLCTRQRFFRILFRSPFPFFFFFNFLFYIFFFYMRVRETPTERNPDVICIHAQFVIVTNVYVVIDVIIILFCFVFFFVIGFIILFYNRIHNVVQAVDCCFGKQYKLVVVDR